MEYVVPLIYPVTDFGRIVGGALTRALQHLHDHVVPHPRNNYHPHILGHRSLALYSMAVVTVKVLALCAPLLFSQANLADASAITASNIFVLTNSSRAEFSAPALTINQKLVTAAELKAQALLDCQCFSHNITTDGKTVTPWDFIHGAGYNYLTAGENLAIDFMDAESVEQAWMNSPGHKANIVNKNFEEIGIGVKQGLFQGHQSIVVVQEFGTQAVEQVAMKQNPTPPAAVATVSEATPAKVAEKPIQQVASASNKQPVATPVTVAVATPAAEPVAQVEPKIVNSSVAVKDGSVTVSVDTAGSISKVVAHLGPEAVMLDAKSDTHWEGVVSLAHVAQDQQTVTISATDSNGKVLSEQVASFSNTMASNFTPTGSVQPAATHQITVLGHTINLDAFEQQFYLIFITLILTALIVTIAVRRHVQHVSLIAHSAFVVVLAVLMFAGV